MKRRILKLSTVLIAFAVLFVQPVLGTITGVILTIHAPRQTVDALRNDQPIQAKVGAQIVLLTNGRAAGSLRLASEEDGTQVLRATEWIAALGEDGELEPVRLVLRNQRGGGLNRFAVIPCAETP